MRRCPVQFGVRALIGLKERTPVPPRPYHVDGLQAKLPGKLKNLEHQLSGLDPDVNAHFRAPKFETKSKQNLLEQITFGANRDWFGALQKIWLFIIVVLIYNEFVRGWEYYGEAMKGAVHEISPIGKYARDEEATEKELRESGFAYVGVQELASKSTVIKDGTQDNY